MKKVTVIILLLFSSNFLFSQIRSAEKIKIKRENLILNGIIFPVNGEDSLPTVLLLNGFPGGESDVLGIGEKLQTAGIVTLTFNYSGTYGSEGKYSMEYTMKDIEAAFDFLRKPNNVEKYHIDTTKIYLGGYSYGGGMSLTYAANHSEIKKVFSIAGTDHGEFFREYFKNEQFAQMIDSMFEQLKAPNGPVRFEEGKMPKDITPEDVAQIDSTIDLRECAPLISDRNILLFAGIDDPMVTMENHMLPLYRTLKNENAYNVKFVTFQDDHSFKKSRDKISEIIIDWVKN
jgi:dipeptidyl aminopeptidase/acylaminoacyl peptidase